MNGQNSGAQHQHPQKSRGSRSSSFDAGTAYETTANAQYQPDGTAQAEDQIIELTGAKAPEEMTRKCWICFEEELESEIIKQGSESDWRSPCQCSLAAHEECLLTWVDETQKSTSTGVNSSRTIRCPQCKQAYKIRSKYSVGVNLMTIADQWITRALLATIPLGVIKSLGITCFYYGQGAILDVLGEERLTKIILSLKQGDEIRYIIGASIIPFALVGSRFDLFNFVLPLIPSLVCFSDTSFVQSRLPMDSSPALWICVLPWLRNLYCYGWRKILGKQEAIWKAEAGLIKPNITELAPGIGVREVPAADHRRPQDLGAADVEQEQNQERVPNDEDDAVAERWIFVESPKFARLIAGALLMPKIAAMTGNLLNRMTFVRKRFPHRFQQVLIGGASFVVMKDLFSLLYLYNRAKGRSTRHIMNRKPVLRSNP